MAKGQEQVQRVRKVVVVGGGTAGWMAASALAKMMGSLLEIELVESDAIGIVGVGEATIPQIQIFNRVLDLDEAEFLRACHGTIKLGIEFHNWGKPGDRYIHAFGEMGTSLHQMPFHQYWLRHVQEGGTSTLWDYMLNARAAAANKFAPMADIRDTPLTGLAWAYHFDASLYAKFLRGKAESWGVKRTEGMIANVNLRDTDGFVKSLTLEDGREIEGDLFVDCSGFRGLVIEQALQTGYEDWTHWLPCDRAAAVPCESVEPLTPYTQAIARDAGWQWRIPLQHRIGNGHVFCSDFISEDEAVAQLLDNLDGNALAEPRVLKFTTGRRRKFWNKNCVALGLASGFMEPLESTSIHLIQSGVSRLLAMFPLDGYTQADEDEFNRQAIEEFEFIRDFIILHYKLTSRDDTLFWQRCREMEIPDSLQHRMDLFAANGRLFRHAEELFREIGWLQVMVGQGIMPKGHHPMVDRLPKEQLEQFLADIQTILARSVDALPDHGQYVAQHFASKMD